MKACGIVGSPKKDGNVDLLVSQVLKGAASQGAETSKLYLNDMKIKTLPKLRDRSLSETLPVR
jgi:multimeric flavodoxin WrbA